MSHQMKVYVNLVHEHHLCCKPELLPRYFALSEVLEERYCYQQIQLQIQLFLTLPFEFSLIDHSKLQELASFSMVSY